MGNNDRGAASELTAITTVTELAAALRRVRAQAGNPSLRAIQQWGIVNGQPLPRTKVADMLRGRRLPRLSLLLAFLSACGVAADAVNRWADVWSRLGRVSWILE